MSAKSTRARRFATIIAIGIAFSWCTVARVGAQGDKAIGKAPAPAVEPAKKPMQTRVFTPKHTDPAEVLQAIEMLLNDVGTLGLSGLPGTPAAPNVPGVPGVQPGAGALGGVPGGAPAPAGGAGLGGLQGGIGGLGGLGGFQGAIGGVGMMGMVGAGPPPPPLHLALDKRTGSVIVRLPEKDIQIATDLFKVLDNPPDKPLPEVKSLRVFPLKHALASNIANLAGELDMGAALLAMDEAKLLVAVGPPEAVRQVVELVNALDVAEEKRPNQKLKKLFGPEQQKGKEAAAE